MKALVWAAGAAVLASGCVVVDADTDLGSEIRAWDEEPLKKAEVGRDTVTITVSSNGCTKKDDFDVDVDTVRERKREYALTFEREREDRCRALIAEGVALEFSFDELGVPEGAEIFIRNPFAG